MLPEAAADGWASGGHAEDYWELQGRPPLWDVLSCTVLLPKRFTILIGIPLRWLPAVCLMVRRYNLVHDGGYSCRGG